MASESPKPKTLTARIWAVLDAATTQESAAEMRRRKAYPLYIARVLLQVIRQWARDRCPQQAASLAFQTALSLVPIVAVSLTLIRAFGTNADSRFVEFVSDTLVPVSQDKVAAYLLEWTKNLTFANAGLPGIVFTLILAFILYSNTEKILNDIWRTGRRRPLAHRFVVFYALATLVPLLMGISVVHAASYGLTSGLTRFFTGLAASWAALFFANKLLPSSKVKWAPAAAGSLVSALLFELAKNLFRAYVSNVALERYQGIYGALGTVPLLLVWIYYSWLVVLFGAEIAHAVQNLNFLERQERRSRSGRDPAEMVNGATGARIMCAIVSSWREGKKGITKERLAAAFDLPEDIVGKIVARLKARDLVMEVEDEEGAFGLIPARPPADITLAEVMAPFRGSDVLGVTPDGAPTPLDDVLADIETAISHRSSSVSLEELTRRES